MQREILFRAQSKLNGKWHYGSLVKGQEEDYDYIIPLDSDISGDGIDFYKMRVITKSIGQYIGLKDKNEKQIFSGDIIVNGLSGTWIVQPLEMGSFSLFGISDHYRDMNFNISALNKNAEVISNIHENPEPLNQN